MGEKRQYDDEAGASANKRYKGAHRQHPDFKKNTPRPESNNWAKKRVRTIERRLRNPDGLPGHVQVEMRRELAALNDQLEGKQEKKQRSTMISKYHMIRFFGTSARLIILEKKETNRIERRKAERLQKQLTKRLRETSDADERAEIETDLAIAEIDNLYARYYPFMDAYISLYPKSKDSKDKEDKEEKNEEAKDATEKYGKSSAAAALRAPRPAMWQLIKTTSQEGGVKALEKIRDRPASGNQALTGEDIGEIAAAKEKKDKKAKSDKKEKKEKSEKKDKKDKKDKSEKSDKADKVEKKDKKEKKKAEESESEEEAVPKGIDVAGDDSDEEGGFFE